MSSTISGREAQLSWRDIAIRFVLIIGGLTVFVVSVPLADLDDMPISLVQLQLIGDADHVPAIRRRRRGPAERLPVGPAAGRGVRRVAGQCRGPGVPGLPAAPHARRRTPWVRGRGGCGRRTGRRRDDVDALAAEQPPGGREARFARVAVDRGSQLGEAARPLGRRGRGARRHLLVPVHAALAACRDRSVGTAEAGRLGLAAGPGRRAASGLAPGDRAVGRRRAFRVDLAGRPAGPGVQGGRSRLERRQPRHRRLGRGLHGGRVQHRPQPSVRRRSATGRTRRMAAPQGRPPQSRGASPAPQPGLPDRPGPPRTDGRGRVRRGTHPVGEHQGRLPPRQRSRDADRRPDGEHPGPVGRAGRADPALRVDDAVAGDAQHHQPPACAAGAGRSTEHRPAGPDLVGRGAGPDPGLGPGQQDSAAAQVARPPAHARGRQHHRVDPRRGLPGLPGRAAVARRPDADQRPGPGQRHGRRCRRTGGPGAVADQAGRPVRQQDRRHRLPGDARARRGPVDEGRLPAGARPGARGDRPARAEHPADHVAVPGRLPGRDLVRRLAGELVARGLLPGAVADGLCDLPGEPDLGHLPGQRLRRGPRPATVPGARAEGVPDAGVVVQPPEAARNAPPR